MPDFIGRKRRSLRFLELCRAGVSVFCYTCRAFGREGETYKKYNVQGNEQHETERVVWRDYRIASMASSIHAEARKLKADATAALELSL